MPTGMLWMALGIAGVAWLPRLPSMTQLAGAAIAGAVLIASALWLERDRKKISRDRDKYRIVRFVCTALGAASLGFVWGCAYGYHVRSGLLPLELEQRSLVLRGHIDGLIEQREGFARAGEDAQRPALHFQFAIDAASDEHLRLPRLIQLNWHDADTSVNAPRPGEYWQLRVKLKRPRGFANPGGFDYEAWLVANRIGATGYVERGDDNRKLADADAWSVDAVRGVAHAFLLQRLRNFTHRDLLLGLLLGDGGAISSGEWDIFRATGTVHLFVVSGLQIAFTGGLALWFARCWWRSPWCASRRRNYAIGVAPAFAIALIYALLAGWGVPIQRALIMFAVLAWALIARRQIRASTSWIAALSLVLLFDPLAVLDIGFWFSFIAVGAILSIICGHRGAVTTSTRAKIVRNGARWWQVQWALFATSLPLLLMLSGQLTLLALPANLVAIPLSTFISLPLAFLALLADATSARLSESIWRAADISLEWLWRYLSWLQEHGTSLGGHFNFAIWHPLGIDPAICAFAALAAALSLLPRGTPVKLFAAILLVPLFAPPLEKIAEGDCSVTVIDVGQGLSVLVQTARHALLYDTGPPFGPDRTVADLTVIPVLRKHGLTALDTVVVSHRDSDHAGGWPAIAREFDVSRLLMGEALAPLNVDSPYRQSSSADAQSFHASIDAEFCNADMHWRWDAVDFNVLYPPRDNRDSGDIRNNFSGNNRSCVLQISAGGTRILLTGDIERGAEFVLLENSALQRATLLLAPHHGSHSSSTQAFVDRVRPAYVVFSTGYLNRFKHPHADIADRYRQSGAQLFDTAYTGAITFAFARERAVRVAEQRPRQQHYWD